MSKSTKNDGILLQVEKLFLKEWEKLDSSKEWTGFSISYKSFVNAAHKDIPFDPRFNAVHWGFDVGGLCYEIAFGYCRMNAYAKYYRNQITPETQLSHEDFHASYFADNCITRIDSCRDKLALMVWAFYCPFSPEKRNEILDYQKIMERLRYPLKFGLTIKNKDVFVRYLEKLIGNDFTRIETYRHNKIHRIEPRIEIHGVKPHHGWPYMFPLYEEQEIKKWEKELEKEYPNEQHREGIKEGCYINGVLFDARNINDSLWDYDEVNRHIKSSMNKLLEAAAGCFGILKRRSPLRKQSKNTGW